MITEKFFFAGSGGMELPARLWQPDEEPQIVLQITHGMTEHSGRYDTLARRLAPLGVAVAAFDLRGHGENPGSRECASFGEGGWDASLADMHRFYLLLRRRFPASRHIMLGFSLGSFLLREYLGRYQEPLAGAAILGTGGQPGAVLAVMQRVAQGQIRKAGFDNTTPLVESLTFGTYNRGFRPNRTASDWLCADEARLDEYLADPLCRRSISAGLFWQLLGAMKRTGDRQAYATWNKTLPVLLLSGADDPVGDKGKGVRRVKREMEAAGMRNVTLHLLPQARHDLLHEKASGAADRAVQLLTEWMLQC